MNRAIQCFLLVGFLFVAIAFSATTAVAQGDERARAQDRAKAVAPFIGEQWVTVARLDVARLQVGDLFGSFLEPLAGSFAGDQLEVAKGRTGEIIEPFIKAGGKEVYMIGNGRPPFSGPPIFFLPLSSDANPQALTELLKKNNIEAVVQVDGGLLCGSPGPVAAARTMKPAQRPELVEAFLAAGDTTFQYLFLPTEDDRRAIETFFPVLPPQAGGGPTAPLLRGFSWLAFGLDLPPKISVKLVIQSPDAKSATEFFTAVSDVYAAMKKGAGDLESWPAFVEQFSGMIKLEHDNDRLVASLNLDEQLSGLLDMLKPVVVEARGGRTQQLSLENLRQIGRGVNAYHAARNVLPGDITDSRGKPLLSWRVQLLPMIGQEDLYKEFHLDEPWDSKHNRPLVAKMPRVYGRRDAKTARDGRTVYLAPHGAETVWDADEPLRLNQIEDGPDKTIFLVEADDDHAVEWTKPADWQFDRDNPKAGLAGAGRRKFEALFCDGSARALDVSIDPDLFKALLTRAGHETVNGP